MKLIHLYNAKIYLGNKQFCDSLIILEGRILAISSDRETFNDVLKTLPPDTEKIDAKGALVLPGFYDAHLHLMWVGRRAFGIECAGAKSVWEIINRGKEYIQNKNPVPCAYIRGSGADPDRFEGEKRDLTREDLDKITTLHPLIISRHCGHTIYCNSAALKIAGLSEHAPDIDGGTIEKDAEGRPTGVLKENASVFVQKQMPAPSVSEMKEHIRLAMKKARSLGITKCGSYDVDGPDFDDIVQAYREVYDEFKNEGKPGLRVGLQCGISLSEEILIKHIERAKSASGKGCAPLWKDGKWGTFLSIEAIKLFADGTLGGHTAYMSRPYCDNPATRGFPLMEEDKLNLFVKKAHDNGMQVLIHAIGDAGIDMVLRAFEKVTDTGKNPLNHGVIHCQITTPALLERMARNKITAMVQPGFLEDDIHILESRVGKERALTSYAWNSMIKKGIPVKFSTDAPVCGLNPLSAIQWAVNRGGYYPNERVDIHSAVDAYITPLKQGNYADLVFLDRDIFTIPALTEAKVLRTMCAGVTVYES